MTDRGFTGFKPAAFEFLAGLSADNSRTYFEAHRATYESAVAGPARALVVDLCVELRSRISSGISADPRVGKSLFRINRDLRFSRDRTPYNPWIDAVFWEGGEDARRLPSLLLRIAEDHVVVGAGVMGLSVSQLARFRSAVDDPDTGSALASVIDAIRTNDDSVEISSPSRRGVPAGYRKDHPRADLLRLETLHATSTLPIPRAIGSADFVSWIAGHHERFAPLHHWLVALLRERA